MRIYRNTAPPNEAMEKGDEQKFDFWSDEGAQRFNEILDEGSAYAATGGVLTEDFEAHLDEGCSEYLDPEPCDPEEETLPPGEMEMIFENCFIM